MCIATVAHLQGRIRDFRYGIAILNSDIFFEKNFWGSEKRRHYTVSRGRAGNCTFLLLKTQNFRRRGTFYCSGEECPPPGHPRIQNCNTICKVLFKRLKLGSWIEPNELLLLALTFAKGKQNNRLFSAF